MYTLHLSAHCGRTVLLRSCANLNAQTILHDSLFTFATQNDNVNVVKLLLDHGADCTSIDGMILQTFVEEID